MKSEIRDSTISALSERVRKRNYAKYLSGMRLVKLRGFEDVEVRFDFPVTALIGPNGAGKTTILGAAGLIYDSVPPRRFFAKSGTYDASMRGWKIEYELIDRNRQGSPSVNRTASYLLAKWNRDAMERVVVISGISRTLPASERKDTYRFIKGDFAGAREITFSKSVVDAVENILGKAAANYLQVDADAEGKNSIYAVRGNTDTEDSYSEFHFGAGEASIIRIVSRIEEAPDYSLLLIEEIENGLHPVATRRLVEYLVDVARRKSCQVIFTTHSNDALAPLPTEAVWSTYRGRITQGKLDVAALRTLTGQVQAQLAVFTEDEFAAKFAEVTLRSYCQAKNYELAGIEIHALGGASPARDHTRFQNGNPTRNFPAIALLDGDKRNEDGYRAEQITENSTGGEQASECRADIVYGPGDGHPEEAVFEDIHDNLDRIGNLLGKLTIALQLDTPMQSRVRASIEERRRTNRDIHVIFAQIGEDLDFLSESLVQRAFLSTWANTFPDKVCEVWDACEELFIPKPK
ncbi:AAA family ATPase [Brevibacterium sp. R8603A2]|uniref:ATP-dependent nuclease n=1 Tax=Brevibacterium sp. R8603A2 TaxID=2929779 RepID=UPI001FF8B364|nr:AAA family ATPase [Brevibacterium sp. R8603A2]MCK1802634.1 AAA family ATPase [Brevibacterium sp. R8603A2]